MEAAACEQFDPRVRRTRQLLQQALDKLLQTKDFENISVQDIAEAATVNRATFYDHFADKFALLEYSVAASFYCLISARNVKFDNSCASTLEAIILGVCNYLDGLPRAECERRKQMEPYLESAVIGVVRRTILKGIKEHPTGVAKKASQSIDTRDERCRCSTPLRRLLLHRLARNSARGGRGKMRRDTVSPA